MFRAQDRYWQEIRGFCTAIKKIFKKIIISAVFLLPFQALFAQEAGYYVDYSGGSPKFVQRLVWDSDEYALHYEVLILADNNGYREYSRDITKDNILLVSLPPGKYRYCVTPYDLLGIRGEASEWKEFDVLPAFQPLLERFMPEFFYLDQNYERVLHITGANILEESDIYLQSETDILYPEKVTIIDNKTATLVFDDRKLIPGSYDIHINNPGGLKTYLGEFVVGYRKPLDIFLKTAWTPLIPVSGYLSDVMEPAVFLTGFSVCVQAISSIRGEVNGGMELAASFIFINPVKSLQTGIENFPVDFLGGSNGFLFINIDYNFVLQRRFYYERMALTFLFGFGVIVENNIDVDKQTNIIVQFNLGANYIVRLFNDFYLETGLDFSYYISSNPSGYIKPRLGLVWRF